MCKKIVLSAVAALLMAAANLNLCCSVLVNGREVPGFYSPTRADICEGTAYEAACELLPDTPELPLVQRHYSLRLRAPESDGAALTDTGFTLRSGGSVTLTHLRADQTLTLTETDPGDHTVSWQLNGDDGPTGATCTLQVPRAQPAEITCINTRNVGIPTGLHTGAAPYLALVGLCWLGWRLLRRREV